MVYPRTVLWQLPQISDEENSRLMVIPKETFEGMTFNDFKDLLHDAFVFEPADIQTIAVADTMCKSFERYLTTQDIWCIITPSISSDLRIDVTISFRDEKSASWFALTNTNREK